MQALYSGAKAAVSQGTDNQCRLLYTRFLGLKEDSKCLRMGFINEIKCAKTTDVNEALKKASNRSRV